MVARYRADGSRRWVRRLDGGTYPIGILNDVAVDTHARVFVTGNLYGVGGLYPR